MVDKDLLNHRLAGATRRGVVAGLAGMLALPRALRAQSTVFDIDVAIVGAGAAGIAAASKVPAADIRFSYTVDMRHVGQGYEISVALHADEMVVMAAGRVMHQGGCGEAATHRDVSQVKLVR